MRKNISKFIKKIKEVSIDEFNNLMESEESWYFLNIVQSPTGEVKVLVGYAPNYFPIID